MSKLSFVLSSAIAFGLSYVVESRISASVTALIMVCVVAPVLEETLKSLCGRFVNHRGLTGMGFGIIETVSYGLPFGNAFVRIGTTALMHSVCAERKLILAIAIHSAFNLGQYLLNTTGSVSACGIQVAAIVILAGFWLKDHLPSAE